jgi:hypothetical protein
MTFAGADDPNGATIARTRDELMRMGWTVNLINGFGHEVFIRPDIVVRLMRGFLDPILLR